MSTPAQTPADGNHENNVITEQAGQTPGGVAWEGRRRGRYWARDASDIVNEQAEEAPAGTEVPPVARTTPYDVVCAQPATSSAASDIVYWESGGPPRLKWPLAATDIAQDQSSEGVSAQEAEAAIRWSGRWHHLATDVAAQDAEEDGGAQQ